MRPAVVSVSHGFEDANVNLLTGREADPLTGMALYSGYPVTIHAELWSASAARFANNGEGG